MVELKVGNTYLDSKGTKVRIEGILPNRFYGYVGIINRNGLEEPRLYSSRGRSRFFPSLIESGEVKPFKITEPGLYRSKDGKVVRVLQVCDTHAVVLSNESSYCRCCTLDGEFVDKSSDYTLVERIEEEEDG